MLSCVLSLRPEALAAQAPTPWARKQIEDETLQRLERLLDHPNGANPADLVRDVDVIFSSFPERPLASVTYDRLIRAASHEAAAAPGVDALVRSLLLKHARHGFLNDKTLGGILAASRHGELCDILLVSRARGALSPAVTAQVQTTFARVIASETALKDISTDLLHLVEPEKLRALPQTMAKLKAMTNEAGPKGYEILLSNNPKIIPLLSQEFVVPDGAKVMQIASRKAASDQRRLSEARGQQLSIPEIEIIEDGARREVTTAVLAGSEARLRRSIDEYRMGNARTRANLRTEIMSALGLMDRDHATPFLRELGKLAATADVPDDLRQISIRALVPLAERNSGVRMQIYESLQLLQEPSVEFLDSMEGWMDSWPFEEADRKQLLRMAADPRLKKIRLTDFLAKRRRRGLQLVSTSCVPGFREMGRK